MKTNAIVHLLNSAMMPAADGVYLSKQLTAAEFASRASFAYDNGNLISYVGYKSTAQLLSELCGFEIRENRAETLIDDGDILLVARIKYRLGERPNPDAKPALDDLEFRVVYYSLKKENDGE